MIFSRALRSIIITAAVGLSLWVYGTTGRVVPHGQLGYPQDQGKQWIAKLTGWPQPIAGEMKDAQGNGRGWHSVKRSDPIHQWCYDYGNQTCWLLISLFTFARSWRISEQSQKTPTQQISLRFLLVGTLVFAFVFALHGRQSFQYLSLLLLPISYGLACVATECLSATISVFRPAAYKIYTVVKKTRMILRSGTAEQDAT